jgi:ABC-type branched-subunit amino acid transport system permease subunit
VDFERPGDYIAIVTLAFGEIIGVLAVNGQSIGVAGQDITRLAAHEIVTCGIAMSPERLGLLFGLVLSAVGLILALALPGRPGSRWKREGPIPLRRRATGR